MTPEVGTTAKPEEKRVDKHAKKHAGKPTGEPKSSAPTAKDDYVDRMEAQGREWDAQLALWSAKADTASAELKADYHTWQRDFHDRRVKAQEKLEALRQAKHEAWEDVKSGVEAAWGEIKSAVESARKKFD
jgi:hypothetical protein